MPGTKLLRILRGAPPPEAVDTGPAPDATPFTQTDDYATVRPGRGYRAWRIAAAVALGIVILAGIRSIVAPYLDRGDDAPPAAPQYLDHPAAAALAASYAADYLSYDSANPGVHDAAVARWTGQDPSTVDGWAGVGQLRADVVIPGTVTDVDTTTAVVRVTVRVTPATLAEGQAEPDGAATSTGDAPPRAADPGPAALPWQAGTPTWLTLDVPVTVDDGALVVAPTGAVLASDSSAVLTQPSIDTDPDVVADTTDLPEAAFEAYATGDTTYLAAPDTTLTGLGGLVTLDSTTGWAVYADPLPDGDRYATVDVTWALTGTALTTTQQYALSLHQADGRWLVGSIGTRTQESQ